MKHQTTLTAEHWDGIAELLKTATVDSSLGCETEAERDLEGFLKSLARLQSSITRMDTFAYASYHELVLRHGEIFKPARRPANFKKLANKQCFGNSFYTSMRHGLRYVEGYAVASVGVPVHHAWNLNEDGSVVDTTWNDGTAYAGLVFTPEEASRIVVAKKSYGIFDDYKNGHIMLKDRFDKASLVAFYESLE